MSETRQIQSSSTNKFTPSVGLSDWLLRMGVSFAFTSYDAGELYMVGRGERGVTVHFSRWQRPMGLAVSNGCIALGTANHIHRLELTTENLRGGYDAVYVPRTSILTGNLDSHEIAFDKFERIVFANTRYSCIAYATGMHSFTPIWKPDFVSALVPEDRCHLNGVGMRDGEPRYVSVCSMSDSLHGWRGNRATGGRIIDIKTMEIHVDYSMPHSPRFHGGKVFVLDSGRGLIRVPFGDDIFCPGFLRGLSFVENYALVTVSLPRDGVFKGLPLQEELDRRRGEPWCAVLIVNLDTGAIEEYLRIEGTTKELFDVAVIRDAKCPMSISAHDPQLWSFITFPASAQSELRRGKPSLVAGE